MSVDRDGNYRYGNRMQPDTRSRLRAWREAKGYSQDEAATKIGVAQATWWDWELGDKQPGVDQAIAIQELTEDEIKVADWAMTPDERKARKKRRARKARGRVPTRPSRPPPKSNAA